MNLCEFYIAKSKDFLYNLIISRENYEFVLLEENMIDNKKLKVYLDTSVISYLMQTDALERMVKTLQLWEKFKR